MNENGYSSNNLFSCDIYTVNICGDKKIFMLGVIHMSAEEMGLLLHIILGWYANEWTI